MYVAGTVHTVMLYMLLILRVHTPARQQCISLRDYCCTVCCVFRSIEELQKQNEKLLAVVRELSEEQEEKERETVDVQTKVGGEWDGGEEGYCIDKVGQGQGEKEGRRKGGRERGREEEGCCRYSDQGETRGGMERKKYTK